MSRIPRKTILNRLRKKLAQGEPIIGGGAGTGLSAKCEEAGGIDLIVIYNSGRYRMAGRGSLAGLLAYGNANEIVCDMAREVLPVVKHTPVLAGVNGTDPFIDTKQFLMHLSELGFSGIQNFPTVGLIDGTFRANLEETGMGYGQEIELMKKAVELDLLTTPYVFNEADAVAMASVGVDMIVCHLGLTTGGAIGAKTALNLLIAGLKRLVRFAKTFSCYVTAVQSRRFKMHNSFSISARHVMGFMAQVQWKDCQLN